MNSFSRVLVESASVAIGCSCRKTLGTGCLFQKAPLLGSWQRSCCPGKGIFWMQGWGCLVAGGMKPATAALGSKSSFRVLSATGS